MSVSNITLAKTINVLHCASPSLMHRGSKWSWERAAQAVPQTISCPAAPGIFTQNTVKPAQICAHRLMHAILLKCFSDITDFL